MKIPVLDHGYVELIECWGTGKDGSKFHPAEEYPDDPESNTAAWLENDFEVGIIEAARQSTQGSFRGWETDGKLLKFLAEHDHNTPFEFSGMIIEVQAPIMVFREWHRHRTQSYNEASARYAPLPDLCYEPERENLISRIEAAHTTSNKQASSTVKGGWNSTALADFWLQQLEDFYHKAETEYQWALSNGIPKELARLVMPVGHYTKMRASANLRNWLQFLLLRMDSAAQWEIRQYANAVAQLIAAQFPRTWELFNERLTASQP